MNEIRFWDKKVNKKGQKQEFYLLVLLGICIFMAYSNSAGSPFIFDDRVNILENTYIRITDLSFASILNGLKGPLAVRPVANLSFAFNYYFSKYDVFTYHIINILIHILNACLLYYFLKYTLNIHYKKSSPYATNSPVNTGLHNEIKGFSVIAFSIAAIWAFNPLHIQSVTYIVQRMNSMATLFFMLALVLYIKGRLAQAKTSRQKSENLPKKFPLIAIIYFGGSTFAWLLSFGCKEIAVGLPFFIFLYELFFFQELNPRHFKIFLIFVFGSLIIAGVLLYFIPGNRIVDRIINSYDFFDFTLKQRVLTESRVVIYYLSLLFYPNPSRLLLDYDFTISKSLLAPPSTLLAFLTIAFLLMLAFYIAKKERLISFGIFWFFGNLVVESSFIGLDIIFEHRTYLPSMMVFPIPILLMLKIRRFAFLGWIPVICGVIIICAMWTYERNSVWQSRESIWRDSAIKAPGNPRAHYNLGRAMIPKGNFAEAAKHFRKALHLNPEYPDAQKNLEIVLAYDEAKRKYPETAQMYNYLGVIFWQKGDMEHAAHNLLYALKFNPEYKAAHFNLGRVLVSMERLDQAVIHFQAALKIDPHIDPHDDTILECLQKTRKDQKLKFSNLP